MSMLAPRAPFLVFDHGDRALIRDAEGAEFLAVFGDRGFARANAPTAITLAGYVASLAWLAGAPWWVGAMGILADEVDGRLARARGETTKFGGELDYAVDLTLTGLTAFRAFGPWGVLILPFTTAMQASQRALGQRPQIGSARAVFTVAAMIGGAR